jgi:hypothetical protein
MVLVIYIPVLFACVNNQCNFMQANSYYTREAECKAVVEAQKKRLQEMSLKAGQMVTLLEGTCVTAKDGML